MAGDGVVRRVFEGYLRRDERELCGGCGIF